MPSSSSSSSNHQENSVHVFKKDIKFSNRLQSLDTSTDSQSFRIYYAVAPASIPFTWESQPGTPKRDSVPKLATINPPLTPPPSYQFHTKNTASTVGFKNKKLSGLPKKSSSLFTTLVTAAFSLKKKPHTPSSASLTTTWTDDDSLSPMPKGPRHRMSFSTPSAGHGDEEPEEVGSAKSSLCFGMIRSTGRG